MASRYPISTGMGINKFRKAFIDRMNSKRLEEGEDKDFITINHNHTTNRQCYQGLMDRATVKV